MSVSATDADARDCIDRSREPLAQLNALQHWEPVLHIADHPHPVTEANGSLT